MAVLTHLHAAGELPPFTRTSMLSPQTIRDQLRLAGNPARLRIPTFAVIDRAQALQGNGMCTGGELILSTALALIAMCETVNLPIQDVMTKATNMLADVDGPFTSHIQAVRDYAGRELLGKE